MQRIAAGACAVVLVGGTFAAYLSIQPASGVSSAVSAGTAGATASADGDRSRTADRQGQSESIRGALDIIASTIMTGSATRTIRMWSPISKQKISMPRRGLHALRPLIETLAREIDERVEGHGESAVSSRTAMPMSGISPNGRAFP